MSSRKFERFFRPKSGGLQKKKINKKYKKVFTEIETDFSEIQTFFSAQNKLVSKKKKKKKKIFTEMETNFSAEIVRFRLVGGMLPELETDFSK